MEETKFVYQFLWIEIGQNREFKHNVRRMPTKTVYQFENYILNWYVSYTKHLILHCAHKTTFWFIFYFILARFVPFELLFHCMLSAYLCVFIFIFSGWKNSYKTNISHYIASASSRCICCRQKKFWYSRAH